METLQSNERSTVVFDIGRVLVDFKWERCLETLGYYGEFQKELAKYIFYSEVWKEGDRGNAGPDEWVELFVKNAPQYEKEIRNIYEHLDLTIRKFPYTDQMIKTFRDAGFRIYYLSNYSEYLYEKSKQELAFLDSFDGGVFSYKVNCLKPEKEIYKQLLTRYNINSDETWFFDDRAENVEGAEKAGMHGIVFSSKTVEEILSGKYTGGNGK